jgi:peptidoglycan/xylan/chitin deacetylase (PgdA/CDA1 family)
MDDGVTALRNRPRQRPPTRRRPPPRRRAQAHHIRRRAIALLVLGVIVVVIGLSLSGGGGPSVAHAPAHAMPGYFGRIQTLAGTGAGSFTYAQQAAETAAINKTLTYTPYVRVAGAQHREIALTFDDGPGPYTPKILAALKRHGVPATFFEVGSLETYFHDSTSAIIAAGDAIGDHTESHAPMSRLSRSDQQDQLITQTQRVGTYGAPFPRLFRPPYGLWDSTTLRLLRKYKMLMVLWTVDTSDYRLPGVDAIVQSAVSGARPGAIILMHDGGGNRQETVDAVPLIISQLRARGYRLVTVPRLLLDNPAPANQEISSIAGGGG